MFKCLCSSNTDLSDIPQILHLVAPPLAVFFQLNLHRLLFTYQLKMRRKAKAGILRDFLGSRWRCHVVISMTAIHVSRSTSFSIYRSDLKG